MARSPGRINGDLFTTMMTSIRPKRAGIYDETVEINTYERYMGSDWNLDSNNCTSFSISQVVEDAAREIKADRKSTELERGQAAVVLRFASHCVSPQGTINVLDGITSENDWISVNGQPSNNEKNEKNEGCCRDSSSK